MTALDTNVLLRLVLADDPVQSPLAEALFAGFTAEDPGYLSLVVTAELMWVLRSGGVLSRQEIAWVLQTLLRNPAIAFQSRVAVERAVTDYAEGAPGFADHLVSRLAQEANAGRVVTFDRRASRLPGWELPGR